MHCVLYCAKRKGHVKPEVPKPASLCFGQLLRPTSYHLLLCTVQDAQELQNVEILKNSPYVNPGSKRTPYAQQMQKQHASYIISPYRCACRG